MSDSLIANTRDAFIAQFGVHPDIVVQAPGRVNLIGEHTDYNDGLVLPCAIDYKTVISARLSGNRTVRVVAVDYDNALDEYSLDEPITPREDMQWANYVRGVVKELVDMGLPMVGMDMAIAGDVPQGAGLSSSASLEVAVCRLFATQPGFEDISLTKMALIAQRAENEFVGCKCGNMDQIISANGVAGHALLIDCRSLEVAATPIPSNASIVIINSQVRRGLVESAYNKRREQCEAAAAHYGVKALRDVTVAQLEAGAGGLDAEVLKRARHVVTENDRVELAVKALADGDLVRMGELMEASHVSMRDDFEITVPAIDHLVSIVKNVIGASGGVRMTGGGFGGCVVALVPNELVDAVRAAIDEGYRSPSDEHAIVYVCTAAPGAGEVVQ